jgi:hypothetical protein
MEADWLPRCFLRRNWSYLAYAGTSGDIGLPCMFLFKYVYTGFTHGSFALRAVIHNNVPTIYTNKRSTHKAGNILQVF